MDDNKKSLTDFIKENSTLLTAFGVFTALALYFKNSELPETSVFAPLFLSLLIIFELYKNLLPEIKNASTILSLFEGGLSIVLFSVLLFILSTSSLGRFFFGMGLTLFIFNMFYHRIKKYITNKFETHRNILAVLYLLASFMWYFILNKYVNLLNFEAPYKEIIKGLLAGSFIIISLVLLKTITFKVGTKTIIFKK